MTYTPWNLFFFPFRWMWYGCSGRRGIRVAFERWVYFTIYLIMRYIIPRIWAWKFHSIVENLIWYFFFSVVLRFSTKMRRKKSSRESFAIREARRDGIWRVIAFLFHLVLLLFPIFYLRLQEIYSHVRWNDERFSLEICSPLRRRAYQIREIFSLSSFSCCFHKYLWARRLSVGGNNKKETRYSSPDRLRLILNGGDEDRVFKNNKISLYRVLSEILSSSKISSLAREMSPRRVWIKDILYLISSQHDSLRNGWQKYVCNDKDSPSDEMRWAMTFMTRHRGKLLMAFRPRKILPLEEAENKIKTRRTKKKQTMMIKVSQKESSPFCLILITFSSVYFPRLPLRHDTGSQL